MKYPVVNLGQTTTPSSSSPPSAAVRPRAICVTVGPVSKPDPKKIQDFLQADPPGKFWLNPLSEGPGDEQYVIWCNAVATPVPGAVPWSPPAPPSTPTTVSPEKPSPVPSMAPPPEATPFPTALAVGGLAAIGLVTFLALR